MYNLTISHRSARDPLRPTGQGEKSFRGIETAVARDVTNLAWLLAHRHSTTAVTELLGHYWDIWDGFGIWAWRSMMVT
jgi:hypothetical protein